MRIPEIFALRGEAEFRAGERRVIARLLNEPQQVIATGGGAYMDAQTRARIREKAVCLWLKAELPVLMKRDDLGADVWAEIIQIMPISSGMKAKLVASFTKPKEPDPMAERLKAAQLGQEEAEVSVKQTKAQLQAAQAGQAQVETQREMITPIEDPNLAHHARIEAARGSGGLPG